MLELVQRIPLLAIKGDNGATSSAGNSSFSPLRPRKGAKESEMAIHWWFMLNRTWLAKHQGQVMMLTSLLRKNLLRMELRNSLEG